jgi:hypothetical protein
MAFCVHCGAQVTGRFCGACGIGVNEIDNASAVDTVDSESTAISTEQMPKRANYSTAKGTERTTNHRAVLLPELRLFNRLVLLWFLVVLPLVLSIGIFHIYPSNSRSYNLGVCVSLWIVALFIALIVISPIHWLKKGSWKARRRAGWLFLAAGWCTMPSELVGAPLQFTGIVCFWAYYYFINRKTLNSSAVMQLAGDWQPAPSWKKRKAEANNFERIVPTSP